MSCEAESPEEGVARRLLQAEYSQSFSKVCPSTRPGKVVDLESTTGSTRRVAEVKVLTSEEMLRLQHALDERRSFDSTVLTKRWTVFLEPRTLGDVFRPVPAFKEPDPDFVQEMANAGFKVHSAAERAEEFRTQNPPKWRDTPQLRRMGQDLEPHLKVLEEAGVESTWAADWPSQATFQAGGRIAQRTQDAICASRDPTASEGPGVDVTLVYGGVRTGSWDSIVARISVWLESDLSSNLLESLETEPDAEHHAVVFVDPASEPEAWADGDANARLQPTRPLALPAAIDVFWFVLRDRAFRFDRDSSGWTERTVPR